MNTETTPTQKTAMQMMRKEIDDRIEHAKYSVVANELKVIRNIIDMGYLEIEKQQILDTFDEAISEGRQINAETYFNKTFNPK
jgi:hypothetical protein